MLLEARMHTAPCQLRRGGGTWRHKTNDFALLEHDSHSWCSVATKSSLCFNQKTVWRSVIWGVFASCYVCCVHVNFVGWRQGVLQCVSSFNTSKADPHSRGTFKPRNEALCMRNMWGSWSGTSQTSRSYGECSANFFGICLILSAHFIAFFFSGFGINVAEVVFFHTSHRAFIIFESMTCWVGLPWLNRKMFKFISEFRKTR